LAESEDLVSAGVLVASRSPFIADTHGVVNKRNLMTSPHLHSGVLGPTFGFAHKSSEDL